MKSDDTMLLLEALCVIEKQHQLICTLSTTVSLLKQRNEQLEELCKQHARAVDFYIKKLDEAERQLRIRKGLDDGN